MTSIASKRKSDASDATLLDDSDHSDYAAPIPAKKRARTATASTSKSKKSDALAPSLVANILANPASFELPAEEDVRDVLLSLAKYAKSLEGGTGASVKMTTEELEAAANKLRKAARSQIQKQMTMSSSLPRYVPRILLTCMHHDQWKPSCKTGTAKWSYDGVSPNLGKCRVPPT